MIHVEDDGASLKYNIWVAILCICLFGMLEVLVRQPKRSLTPNSVRNLFTVIAFTLVFVITDCSHAKSDSYSDIIKLTKNTIENSDLNTEVRPLLNQSLIMTVKFGFSLVSLVSVDDVTQSCAVNGFISLTWMNELLRWNTSDYGGFAELQTQPYKLWHPRLILINVAGEREVIEQNRNPIIIHHTGNVTWVPGAIFTVACDLDVRKFPFDEQTCHIFFCPMGYFSDKLVFVVPVSEADKTFFYPNKEWNVKKISLSVSESTVSNGVFSCPKVTLHLKRKPAHFVFNLLAPVLMLSFLNLFVFTIPAESGEKVSYGITVLLSMSVYMSEVNSKLPGDSDELPAVTIYLFLLMTNSVLSVLASIVTVFLYHSEQSKLDGNQDASNKCNLYLPRLNVSDLIMNPRASENDSIEARPMASRSNVVTPVTRKDRLSCISKHINRISLAFFLITWISVSVWFFVHVTI